MIVEVVRHIPFEGVKIAAYRKAILLEENGTFSLWDPANENELARNMSSTFVQMLVDKGWLIYCAIV